MRVQAGSARGRKLQVPAGRATRPTSARVRQALFDRLGTWVVGRTVLDLFAGSGALGIEALSRGAARATFVESSKPALSALRANLATLGFEHDASVLGRPVEVALGRLRGTFDLVVLDPPYGLDLVDPTLAALLGRGLLALDGEIVVVHGAHDPLPVAPSGCALDDHRRQGDSCVTVLRPTPTSEGP